MTRKVGLITGAGSGIGLAAAKLLAQNEYNLIVSDIDSESGQKAKEALEAIGGDHIFVKADVSKFEEVKSLIQSALAKFDQLDLVVNNAGLGPKQLFKTSDHSLEDWDKIIAINQTGVFYGMKLALPQMVKQGQGNIVNVASLAGIKGSATGIAYSASKFAVVGMTKSAALEYAKYGIRINCICPSFTDTPLFNDSVLGSEGIKEKLLKTIPMRRVATTEEIAESVLWLASDKSSFITGHSLIIDGGLSA